LFVADFGIAGKSAHQFRNCVKSFSESGIVGKRPKSPDFIRNCPEYARQSDREPRRLTSNPRRSLRLVGVVDRLVSSRG
jgi:hypothetical protein